LEGLQNISFPLILDEVDVELSLFFIL